MKKTSLVLICVILCMFAFSGGVLAADTWDGTADTSWYNADNTAFEIDTAEKLAGLAKIVNGKVEGIEKDDFAGKVIKLTSNLDLGGVKAADGTWSGKSFTPIGSQAERNSFKGIFDGNGKNISNLYINSDLKYSTGLFSYTEGDAVIKNTNIISGYVTSSNNLVGSLLGAASGNTMVINCSNGADVFGAREVGGLIATADTSVEVWNCYNYGNISSSGYGVGGLFYTLNGYAKNCYNVGTVSTSYTSSGVGIGGIAANARFNPPAARFENCYNIGELTAADSIKKGGISCQGSGWGSSGKITCTMINCHYWKASDKIRGLAAEKAEISGVTGHSLDEMKGIAATLGGAYTVQEDMNNGYPVLKCQIKNAEGNYGYDAEKEGLGIAALSAENGKLAITLNKRVDYTPINLSSFTIEATSQPEGEDAADLELDLKSFEIAPNEDGTASVVTINYTEIPASYSDITINISVSYDKAESVSDSFVILTSNNWKNYAAKEFAGGDGTAADPYEIATAEQLALLTHNVHYGVSTYSDTYFVLTEDIDLKTAQINNKDLYWEPIGSTKRFMGNFNGQGHVIKNMTINTSAENAGLFGRMSRARIYNLKLQNAKVSSDANNVGALIGYAETTDVYNCHVLSGTISGQKNVGGLIGSFIPEQSLTKNYLISGCSAVASVDGDIVGGLVGLAEYSAKGTSSTYGNMGYITIENCYANAKVSSSAEAAVAGGLIGQSGTNGKTQICNCYAAGTVTTTNGKGVGGLIGDCYGWSGPGEMIVKNNVVLVSSLSGAVIETQDAGRISGVTTSSVKELRTDFENNYVINSMKVFDQTDITNGGVNGTAKTADELGKQSIWEKLDFALAENSIWKWDDTLNRPALTMETIPYVIEISTQPVDASGYTNKEVVFVTGASKGVGECTYNWQHSENNGKSWKDFPANVNGKAKLTTIAKYSWDGNLVRCEIKDEHGTIVYTDTAVLTMYDTEYTADLAMTELYNIYKENGIRTVRAPFALYDTTGDIRNFDINLNYDNYSMSYDSDAWVALDYMAQGKTPLNYEKSTKDQPLPETVDLIENILAKQNQNETGSFVSQPSFSINVDYTLALDIFFAGADAWGNETGTHGRDAALNYMFGLLRDDSESGGKYFLTKSKYSCNEDENGGNAGYNSALINNANFAILMARLTDDPVYGKQAKAAMYDVITMLQYEYEQGHMNDPSTSWESGGIEAAAYYLSALVAAENITGSSIYKANYQELQEKVFNSILKAQALDGTYDKKNTFKNLPQTGDAPTTAAVMMALSDYAHGRCLLATMNFETSVGDLIAADLNNLSVPAVVLEDIELPTMGEHGSAIIWKSSDEKVLSAEGKVHRGNKDANVRLTATASLADESISREFDVVIPAQRTDGGDEAFADINSIELYPEYLFDLELPTAGENGSVITWTSSHPEVIAADGKLTRPVAETLDGKEYVDVVLTATAEKGEAKETKEFKVKVWALYDLETPEGMVREAYYQSRYAAMRQTVLTGYWRVWSTYSALGEDITDFDFIYDASANSPDQRGAHILALVALGENPYNYRGQNLIADLKGHGLGGGWSIPVFNTMAADASGMKDANLPLESCASWLKALGMGPDIGGWAAVPISRHYEGYEEHAQYFFEKTGKDMALNSSGSEVLSKGCVITGISAFYAEDIKVDGIAGFDPTKDEPWISQTPVEEMYRAYAGTDGFTGEIGGFGSQIVMELCDLYNVLYNDRQVGWVECGVNKEKLDAQIAKANEILENKDAYTADSVKVIEDALKVVEGISKESLAKEIADYGEEYYTLYDAVRFAKSVDAPVVDETALNEAKETAIAELEAAYASYNSDNYSATNWDKISEAKDQAVMVINAAKDEKAVAAAKEEALAAMAAVPVKSDANKIKVTFRLIGATKSSQDVDFSTAPGEYYGSEYETWIPTETYTVDAGSTLYDVFMQAINKAGLTQVGAEDAYVSSITAPEVLGGYAMAEFTNGPNSGWMYTINGVHPELSIKQYELKDGDKIIFHYCNDFKYEDESTNPDSPYLNKWLDAPDVAPGEKPVPTEHPFTDVAANTWYNDAVTYVYANALMNGTSETTFDPESKLTRAMMATILYRIEGKPAVTDENPFSDVAAGEWYTDAIVWAAKAGVVKGTSQTTFDPQNDITREQMAVMMYRYAAYKGADVTAVNDLATFSDAANVSSWALDAMKWAVGSGLINGVTTDTLVPQGTATRAQAATVLMRFDKEIMD